MSKKNVKQWKFKREITWGHLVVGITLMLSFISWLVMLEFQLKAQTTANATQHVEIKRLRDLTTKQEIAINGIVAEIHNIQDMNDKVIEKIEQLDKIAEFNRLLVEKNKSTLSLHDQENSTQNEKLNKLEKLYLPGGGG